MATGLVPKTQPSALSHYLFLTEMHSEGATSEDPYTFAGIVSYLLP
jgi:hypothetical protein